MPATSSLAPPTSQRHCKTRPSSEDTTKRVFAKFNVSDYPELKEDGKFRDWRRKFTAIATTQGIDHCLDPNFTPIDENDVEYKDANRFIYSVLVVKVHTNTGKTALRMYESSQNGYKVFAYMQTTYEDGLAAEITA